MDVRKCVNRRDPKLRSASFPPTFLLSAVSGLCVCVPAGTRWMHLQGQPLSARALVQRTHIRHHRIRAHVRFCVWGVRAGDDGGGAQGGIAGCSRSLCSLLNKASAAISSATSRSHDCRAPNPDCPSTNLMILLQVLTTNLLQAALLGCVYARFRYGVREAMGKGQGGEEVSRAKGTGKHCTLDPGAAPAASQRDDNPGTTHPPAAARPQNAPKRFGSAST